MKKFEKRENPYVYENNYDNRHEMWREKSHLVE